jgi:hypothetical protein
MKLRALQKYSAVIVIGAVFLVALGITGGLLWKAASEKRRVVQELEQQNNQLQTLLSQRPAPSTENIEALRRERQQLAELYERLLEGVVRPSLTLTNITRPFEFSQQLHETVDRLTQAANRSRVKLPDNFLFGFSRYDNELPCRATGATSEECKKTLALLGKQLVAIGQLGQLLIESQVEAITHIRRTEVDSGGTNPDALAIPISANPQNLYETYPFEVEFVCSTQALRAFLNALARSDQFFTVRLVRVDSVTSTLATGAGGGATDTGGAGQSRQVEKRLLNVLMRVDLVEFTPSSPAPNPPAS